MKLTSREIQLLDFAAGGMTDRQIALQLNISIETVSSYWRGTRLKFQAASRTECVARYSQDKSKNLVAKQELENCELMKEIKERSEAQAEVVAQKNILAAITDASAAYIARRSTLQECLTRLLEDVLNFTNSEFGIIGEVLYEDGRPCLQEHALTRVSWGKNRSAYETVDVHRQQFRNLNSLFSTVMEKQSIVRLNEPGSLPASLEATPSQLVWKTFLGIPVYCGAAVVGMIGLANRDGGYSEEMVEFLQPLITSCATFIVGYRQEQERASMMQRIADSETLAREIIALAPTGVMCETADRSIQVVNQAYLCLFDLPGSPEVLTGMSFVKLHERISDQFLDPAGALTRMSELVHIGKTSIGDVLEFKDGRRYVREFLVMRSSGSVRGYLWRYRDITRKSHTRTMDFLEETDFASHI
ncbi:MAG: GAF domain-containing protein [Fimbriimonas sp.]|nr:GAF domain-containing protein [Fimbriimonas sp.]